LVQVFDCYEPAGLNGKGQTLKPGVVYDGIIAGEKHLFSVLYRREFYVELPAMRKNISLFKLRGANRRQTLRWTMLISGSLSTSGNCSVCVRAFASNSDRQCIPCATHTRTSVDVRSVFPKPIGMNMNVSKYELVAKNDA
jgi:hypothetical protein